MMVLDSSLGSKITIIGSKGVFIVDGELDGDSGNHGECGFLASILVMMMASMAS